MKRTIRIILIVLFAAVLVYCLARLAGILLDYRKTDKLYSGAVNSFVSDTGNTPAPVPEIIPTPAPAAPSAPAEPDGKPHPVIPTDFWTPDPGFTVDFEALQAVNPDIIGWIYIEGTDISYPLLYGTDNSRYLGHAYDGSANNAGSIFLDYTASPDFSDYRSLIYGHRMFNGAMFGKLSELDDPEYLADHDDIYIITPDGILLYRVFAVHYTYTWNGFYADIKTPEKFSEMLDKILEASDVDTGIVPTTENNIITLSTCTGRVKTQRFLAHAVLLYDCRS